MTIYLVAAACIITSAVTASNSYLPVLPIGFDTAPVQSGEASQNVTNQYPFPITNRPATENRERIPTTVYNSIGVEVNTKCKLYSAESTIPNAGIGLYTAVDLEKGSEVGYGDIVIALVDFEMHNEKSDSLFLWDDYSWCGTSFGKRFPEEVDDPEESAGCSPGFGSVANSNPALNNIQDKVPKFDGAGLHRGRDPGAGAFAIYHDRKCESTEEVAAGSELFVSYGEGWFYGRTEAVGLIPMKNDFKEADKLLGKYNSLKEKYHEVIVGELEQDLWELVGNYRYEGRTTNALPQSLSEVDEAREIGTKEMKRPKSVRSLEWLEAHGQCVDNIRPGISTIPQAGRGAFATKFIPKGGLVAPCPLIHIPDRNVLAMHNMTKLPNGKYKRDKSAIVGQQLLLNYCFGHRNSTLLLSPYGALSNLINHNSDSPNAMIRWADPTRSNHQPDWLDLSVKALNSKQHTGLGFDYIASRDIHPGEEVFIDYGAEWEAAWGEHVNTWAPPHGSENYAHASILNEMETTLRTESEQKINPYPSVQIKCRNRFFAIKQNWREQHNISEILVRDGPLTPCKILKREVVDGMTLYTAEIMRDTWNARAGQVLEQIPREVFVFVDPPYSSDVHLRNAFRHEIMIPDDMFPVAWLNRLSTDLHLE